MALKEGIKKAYGITPASMTLWTKDEQLYNKAGMEKYLTWLIDQGAQSISFCGSTGENQAMNFEEQKEIIEHVCKFLGGQVPVVAGTGFYGTKNTIKMSQWAQECGADSVMVILPFYFTPHKKAVLEHFRTLRRNLDIEILVYNNPWFAGYELTTAEVKELVDDGTIQAIKAAHGDPNRVHELKHACGDKLTVLYGHDYCAMEACLAGADGWLSGFPAILPKQCRALQDACFEKDVDKALKLQNNLQDFINYFFYEKKNGVPHWLEICKYTLQAQGLDYAGLPRLPLGDLDAENKKKIDTLLANMG